MPLRSLFPVCLVSLAGAAFGQTAGPTPLSADRPTFSDSSTLIGLGYWQIEAGSTYYQYRFNSGTDLGEITLRRQVSQNIELRIVNLNYEFPEHGKQGFADPGAGLKYRLQTGSASRPELTLEAETSVPLGATAYRTNAFQPSAKFLFSQWINPTWTLAGSVNWSRVGAGDDVFDQLSAGLSLTKAWGPKTQFFYEVYGFNTEGPSLGGSAWADIGILQYLTSDARLDLRVGSSSDESQYGWYVGAGVVIRFK